MSFALMRQIVREKRREARQLRRARGEGGGPWDWKGIPEAENPDGPPEKEHFIAYGLNLGQSREWLEGEWARQLRNGGY